MLVGVNFANEQFVAGRAPNLLESLAGFLDRLVEKRFLFDPDASPDERDVMLAPIEAFWKEHGKKLLWDDQKSRFVEG